MLKLLTSQAAPLAVWALLTTQGIGATCPAGVLSVPSMPLLVVDKDSNTASAVFQLKNNAAVATPLHLRVTDFKSTTTSLFLGSSAALSAGDTAAAPYLVSTPLAAGQTINLKLDVAKLWEAGESVGQLEQDGNCVTNVRAVKYRVPFAIKSCKTPDQTEDAEFYYGKPGGMCLRNDDAMTYPVVWQLTLAGRTVGSGSVTLPPASTVPLDIDLPTDLFTWPASGMLQDDVESGTMAVRFAPKSVGSDSLPSALIPVKLRLHYYAKGWQDLSNLFWVIVLLAIGAAISIAVNTGVPNQLKRNEVRKRIKQLGQEINGVSAAVGSDVLTSLKVELNGLKERLHNAFWFSPNLAAELPPVSQALDVLEGRIDALQQIGQVWDGVLTMPEVPPSLIDQILEACRTALKAATRSGLSAADVAALTAQVAALQHRLDSVGGVDQDFEKALLAEETVLRTKLDKSREQRPDGTLGDIKGDSPWAACFLPGLKGIFDSLRDAGTTVQPAEYFQRDVVVQVTKLCSDYLLYRATAVGQGAQATLDKEQLPRLRKLFDQRSYANLIKARNLVKEVEQNTFEQQIADALTAESPMVVAHVKPKTPTAYDSARFEVRFRDDALNTAAARERIVCEWHFDDDIQEGWKVSHYFTRQRATWKIPEGKKAPRRVFQNVMVKVKFRDSNGKYLKKGNTDADVELCVPVQVVRRVWAGHIGLELLRSSLALLAALIALVVGAQQKIATLSLVQAIMAILIVGITADSIKNLLSTPTTSAGK